MNMFNWTTLNVMASISNQIPRLCVCQCPNPDVSLANLCQKKSASGCHVLLRVMLKYTLSVKDIISKKFIPVIFFRQMIIS